MGVMVCPYRGGGELGSNPPPACSTQRASQGLEDCTARGGRILVAGDEANTGSAQERLELLQNLLVRGRGELAPELRLPGAPVEALHLVGQDHARDGMSLRDLHLEGISLDLARDRTQQRQAHFRVVALRGEDESRAPAGLLMAGLRVEGDSDDVTAVRDVGHWSLPDLASHGRAEVDFAVEVFVGDPGEELVQSRSVAGSDDQRAIDDGDVDLGLLIQPRLRRERLGNADRQAVSPPLNSCSHDSTKYTPPGAADAPEGIPRRGALPGVLAEAAVGALAVVAGDDADHVPEAAGDLPQVTPREGADGFPGERELPGVVLLHGISFTLRACDGPSVFSARAPASRPSARPSFLVPVSFSTGTIRVPPRALRSRLSIPADCETALAVCHAAPSDSQAAPTRAHAVSARAHAVPANYHAIPSNCHAGTSNLHAIPACCLCGSSDP